MKVQFISWLLISINLLFHPPIVTAQQMETDSLEAVLAKLKTQPDYKADTNYINTLAFKYFQIKPDTTILLSQQSIELSNKINYLKGKADALKNTGNAYNVKGEYTRSLTLYNEAFLLWQKASNIKGMGTMYYGKGIVYSNIGKYPEALENYFQALKIREQMNDTLGIASCVNAIGGIYFVQGKYNDALTNYLKALNLSESINFLANIESTNANIGEVYFRQGNYSAAKEYLLKSQQVTEKTGNKEVRAFISTMMGSIKLKQGLYKEATEYYLKTNELANEIGSPEYISRSKLGLGEVYLAEKNYEKALQFTQEGINIVVKMGHHELLRDGHEILSRIYEARGLGMQALYHHKQFKLYADSINNQQTELRAQNLAADYEYSKKEIVLKAEQEKTQLEFKKKTNQQRWIIFSAFAALFTALVVALLIYRSRQKEKRANHLLNKQNTAMDKQKTKLEMALHDLKDTQSQLIQSEKMASLGALTAGIAHEIQNPLNFVNNFSEVNRELLSEMKAEIDKGNLDEAKAIANDVMENEVKINHHGKRADAIVKGMLQHSRSSSAVKESTNINALADEYLRLAYHGLRAKDKSFNATMKTDYDETIGNIKIIPQDIGRVILNLITNAFYAVTEKKSYEAAGLTTFERLSTLYEPIVSVTTKKINARPDDPIGRGKVEIKVADNGNGIPKKVLDKIFQPFFTTKPTGQGTGLGLSLSYDIVKAHGGELKVETKEGEGTEFIIVLPV
jgi:two-component system, NtrC family, sensor kinase